MSEGNPRGDIDYILMANAQDESGLVEVINDYLQEYPHVGKPQAQELLVKRLSELVVEGKIGVYEFEHGRHYPSADDYRDLSTADALVLINNTENWNPKQIEKITLSHCLFQKDPNYFGKYFHNE